MPVPPLAVHHGRARQSPGTRPCVYCRRVLWLPGPVGLYSAKILFIEKHGVESEWENSFYRGKRGIRRGRSPCG